MKLFSDTLNKTLLFSNSLKINHFAKHFVQQSVLIVQEPPMHHLLHLLIRPEDLSSRCLLWWSKNIGISGREIWGVHRMWQAHKLQVPDGGTSVMRGMEPSMLPVQAACRILCEWLLMTHVNYSCVHSLSLIYIVLLRVLYDSYIQRVGSKRRGVYFKGFCFFCDFILEIKLK